MSTNELAKSLFLGRFPGEEMLDTIDRMVSNTLFTNFEGHLENLHYKFPDQNVFKKKLEDGTVEYVIELLLPGFTKEDISISVIDNNTLEVSGGLHKEDKTIDLDNQEEQCCKQEKKDCCSLTRRHSCHGETDYMVEYHGFTMKKKFKRKFLIPNINIDSVNAKFLNGILSIQLKSGKRQEVKNISVE